VPSYFLPNILIGILELTLGDRYEDLVIPGDRPTYSRRVFDCYCFGLFHMGMGILMRFLLVFVVSFFLSSILIEVLQCY